MISDNSPQGVQGTEIHSGGMLNSCSGGLHRLGVHGHRRGDDQGIRSEQVLLSVAQRRDETGGQESCQTGMGAGRAAVLLVLGIDCSFRASMTSYQRDGHQCRPINTGPGSMGYGTSAMSM